MGKEPKDWSSYQGIFLDGKRLKAGRGRSLKRTTMWNPDDFKGKTVLDLGCNNGMLAIEAKKCGASRAVGVDKHIAILGARKFVKEINLDVEFWQVDIESKEFQHHTPLFDVVFFCAMQTHMRDQANTFKWIDSHTREVLYYETNSAYKVEKMIPVLKSWSSFANYDFLGDSGDIPNYYKFFRCSGRDLEKQKELLEQMPDYSDISKKCGDKMLKGPPRWELKVVRGDRLVHFLPVREIEGPIFEGRAKERHKWKVFPIMESIKKYGIWFPLLVEKQHRPSLVQKGLNWHVLEGGHRFMAAKELGYVEIPCKVIEERYVP